jgi:MFS superfamily sulfate permease-like transporter
VSLINLKTLAVLQRVDRVELALAVLATLGVIWVGALKAILIVVALALLRFVQLSARPRAEVLGKVPGLSGFHAIARHADAHTEPGLVLFRFNAPLVFFNAPYFKQQALAAMHAAGPDLRWFVVDTVPMTGVDYTGYTELQEVAEALRRQGAELVLAGRMTEILHLRRSKGLDGLPLADRHFPTLRATHKAWLAAKTPTPAGTPPA